MINLAGTMKKELFVINAKETTFRDGSYKKNPNVSLYKSCTHHSLRKFHTDHIDYFIWWCD